MAHALRHTGILFIKTAATSTVSASNHPAPPATALQQITMRILLRALLQLLCARAF